jgi:hypothetical protein
MKIVTIMPVRNEAWCLGLTARAALMWCDELVILDHASTDRTAEIASEIAEESGRVLVSHMPGGWNEMAHRQCLLNDARGLGATHIAIIDADEIVTGNLLPRIRSKFEATPSGSCVELRWIQLLGGIETSISEGIWASQFATAGFPDRPEFHWSAASDGYQHHHRYPDGLPYRARRLSGILGLMHLQMLNERRSRAKQLLYCLNDKLRWPGRRTPEQTRLYYSWAVYGWQPPQALHGVNTIKQPTAPVPAEWWEPYRELLPHLKPDTEPWQLAECRRIVRENRGIMEGLDDFGVEL